MRVALFLPGVIIINKNKEQEMDSQRMTKINMMGRLFELPDFIIEKIPFLTDAISDNNPDESGIWRVHRSPLVFDHILSFLLDRSYPFPSELEYELKFYRIEYQQKELFHSAQRVLKKVDVLEQSTKSIMSEMVLRQHTCVYDGCASNAIDRRYHCKKHVGYCFFSKCKNKQNNNTKYCDLHRKTGTYCIKTICIHKKLEDTDYCLVHTRK